MLSSTDLGSRLTNQAPFDDPGSCVDIRQKIIERDIVWQPLYDKGISDYGESFAPV